MQLPFADGSWCSTERFSWDMYYPWPPFHATYTNEPGLQIHFSPQDTQAITDALAAALSGVVAAVASALGAFAGVVESIAAHLIENQDGSLDIRMSAHGFQVGNAEAADPNGWIDGAWAPVAAALNALGNFEAPRPADARKVAAPGETTHGKLIKQVPFDVRGQAESRPHKTSK